MKSLMLMICLLIVSNISQASIVVNSLFKYGPNGYEASGNSSSQSSTVKTGKYKGSSSSSSVNDLDVTNRDQLVIGAGIEYVPNESGVCVGGGYYMDNTAQMSLGWKF